MTETVPDPLPNGYHFSRYVIECELPRGEVGRVYKAFDTVTRETVAINILAPELRHDEGRWRLIAGLRRARRKANPQAHDYGVWESIPYVIVTYIEGIGAAVDVAKE